MLSAGRILRGIFAVVAAALLTACAAPALSGRMVPFAMEAPGAEPGSPLYHRIVLTQVGGGEETEPLSVSRVGNRELADALRAALDRFGYLAGPDQGAGFALEVFLVDLKQPKAPNSLIVDSHMRYKLISLKDQSVVFDDLITGSAKGNMNDAFGGTTRLKITTEASIRANIVKFLSRLSVVKPSGR